MTAIDDNNTSLGVYNRTDVGNAERLIDRHGHQLRYCHRWAKWLIWDGQRWRIDDTGRAEALAQDTVKAILSEALAHEGDERKKLVSHAFASERSARIRGLLEMAQSRDGVPVTTDMLDPDPWQLNLQNGTLDLQTLRLKPHDQADLITKLAPVPYQPDARAPRWERFLQEVFRDDHDLVRFVQRAAGYSLTGDTAAQVFFLLHGNGENGKTTLLETLRAILGDYAQQAPADTFLDRRNTGIPNDIARLQGARFVTAVETSENRRLDEAVVKRLTGGDRIAARFMRSEFFEFQPLFKVWLATNHKPQIRGTDHAIWRRIRLIPFTRTFTQAERDPDLASTLHTELPGILTWAIHGLRDYAYGDGLDPPQAVTEATSDYRNDQDILGGFLTENTRDDPQGRTPAADLYRRYKQWAETAGERPETQTAFGLRLRDRGYERAKSHGKIVWSGLRLTDDHDLWEGETSEKPSPDRLNPPRGG